MQEDFVSQQEALFNKPSTDALQMEGNKESGMCQFTVRRQILCEQDQKQLLDSWQDVAHVG